MDHSQNKPAVLITGTSTGIGRHAALRLDQLGYQVYATVRKEQDAISLQSEASKLLTPLLVDVTDTPSLDRAYEIIQNEVGERGLWGLVNNAAVGFLSPLEFAPLDDFRKLYEVNVFGVLAITQKFLPLIRLAKGRIVNISSTASSAVAPFHGPYSSAKLALNGINDALRLELKHLGVQVCLIIYGSVQTPIWDKAGKISTQIATDFPPTASELYGENFRKLREYFNTMGKTGIKIEQSFPPILHALSASNPKPHYYVGMDAQLHYLLRRDFYGRIGDWVILRLIGINTST